MTRFGDFGPLCKDTPSYPWCNLFYRQVRAWIFPSPFLCTSTAISLLHQLQHHAPLVLQGTSADPKLAPVGINPDCAIARVGTDGSLTNVANIVACALSLIFVGFLVWQATRRKAAVCECFFSPCCTSLRTEIASEHVHGAVRCNGSALRALRALARNAARLVGCRQALRGALVTASCLARQRHFYRHI